MQAYLIIIELLLHLCLIGSIQLFKFLHTILNCGVILFWTFYYVHHMQVWRCCERAVILDRRKEGRIQGTWESQLFRNIHLGSASTRKWQLLNMRVVHKGIANTVESIKPSTVVRQPSPSSSETTWQGPMLCHCNPSSSVNWSARTPITVKNLRQQTYTTRTYPRRA